MGRAIIVRAARTILGFIRRPSAAIASGMSVALFASSWLLLPVVRHAKALSRCAPGGFEEVVEEALTPDGTIYSSKYDESRFLAIQPGMSGGEVVAALGPPRDIRAVEGGELLASGVREIWFFSYHLPRARHYKLRNLYISKDGRVVGRYCSVD